MAKAHVTLLPLLLVALVSILSAHAYLPPTSPPPPVYPSTTPPPSPPPYKPPRSRLAIWGVVYCKFCARPVGVPRPLGTPIQGAKVQLVCKNRYVQTVKTDKNGYYFIDTQGKLTTAWARFCKVKLVSSPLKVCNKPTNIHRGATGASLMPDKSQLIGYINYFLYSVDLLAFEPTYCPR